MNAVTKAASMLPGELRRLVISVVDLRKGRTPEPFESVGLAPLGLVIHSARPLQEMSVIRLALHTEPPVIEAWFNVILCVPEGQRFRIELQAFAASGDLRERLSQLWTAAPPLNRMSQKPG